jgi:hypothetical protein
LDGQGNIKVAGIYRYFLIEIEVAASQISCFSFKITIRIEN